MEHKMRALISFTKFVWNISHSKKNSARQYHKCTQCSCQIPVILVSV